VPALARFGLVLLACGMFADLAFHAVGADGYAAHVVMLVGMLVVLSGVVRQGLDARSGNPSIRHSEGVQAE